MIEDDKEMLFYSKIKNLTIILIIKKFMKKQIFFLFMIFSNNFIFQINNKDYIIYQQNL